MPEKIQLRREAIDLCPHSTDAVPFLNFHLLWKDRVGKEFSADLVNKGPSGSEDPRGPAAPAPVAREYFPIGGRNERANVSRQVATVIGPEDWAASGGLKTSYRSFAGHSIAPGRGGVQRDLEAVRAARTRARAEAWRGAAAHQLEAVRQRGEGTLLRVGRAAPEDLEEARDAGFGTFVALAEGMQGEVSRAATSGSHLSRLEPHGPASGPRRGAGVQGGPLAGKSCGSTLHLPGAGSPAAASPLPRSEASLRTPQCPVDSRSPALGLSRRGANVEGSPQPLAGTSSAASLQVRGPTGTPAFSTPLPRAASEASLRTPQWPASPAPLPGDAPDLRSPSGGQRRREPRAQSETRLKEIKRLGAAWRSEAKRGAALMQVQAMKARGEQTLLRASKATAQDLQKERDLGHGTYVMLVEGMRGGAS